MLRLVSALSQPRVIFHVGGSKVGSTALQRVLTARGSRSKSGPFRYLQWRSDGSIGDAPASAADSLGGYAFSPFRISELAAWNPQRIATAADAIVSRAASTPAVLSNEGWNSEALLLGEPEARQRSRSIFGSRGAQWEAVFYVRPQAAWLESFYLQFGIWAGREPDVFARNMQHGHEGMWAERVDALHDMGFDTVSVRYVPDVVDDFMYDVLSLPNGSVGALSVANRRVSLDLLLLMLNDSRLRPDMHSPHVEFLIERLGSAWDLPERPIPPLLGEKVIDEVVAAYSDDNARLMTLLAPEQAEAYSRDLTAFVESRVGTETTTRAELAALPLDHEYTAKLAAGALDEVLRERYGYGLPTADEHWSDALRQHPLVSRLLPQGSARALWATRAVDRLR